MNYTNGSIFTSGSKSYLLQQLTDLIFCLFEIDGHALKVVTGKDGKWQYSEEELPERLAEFEPVRGHLAISEPLVPQVVAPKAEIEAPKKKKTRK